MSNEFDPGSLSDLRVDPDAARKRAGRKTPVASLVVGLVILAVAAHFVLRERADRSVDTALTAIIAEQKARTPHDFGNGFVITDVVLENRDLVYVVHADAASTEALRDAGTVARFREGELAAMKTACDLLAPLLAKGVTATRRYLSDSGAELFHVQLDAAACRG